MSVSGGGDVTATDGKAYMLVPTRTAQWSNNKGKEFTATRHRVGYNVWYEPADDPRTPHTLADPTATNNVYLIANLKEDNMPYLDVRAASAGEPSVDGYLHIASIAADGTVTPINRAPDAEFDDITVDTITDQNGNPIFDGVVPAGQVEDAWLDETGDTVRGDLHTDDAKISLDGLSQNSYLARNSPELEVVLDEGNPNGGRYEFTIAAGEHPESTQADTSVFTISQSGVTHEDEPLATHQWVHDTFIEAAGEGGLSVAYADESGNSNHLGGVSPSAYLRTDITDDVHADMDWNDHAINNLDHIVAGTAGGPLLDLKPNSDGSYIIWEHIDPETGVQNNVRSSPATGKPFVVQQGGDILAAHENGDVRVPDGNVYSQDGQLASHRWANNRFLDEKGGELDSNLDFDGFSAVGVEKIEFASRSGTALDFRPNSDGSHILWQHDNGDANPHEFYAQLNAENGVPWLVRDSTRSRNLIEVHDNGYIAIPYGGLATDGPLYMGTHNYFGDDTTHDIIWKQDNDGSEGHMHMESHEVEIFPNDQPSKRKFWVNIITGEAGIEGDLNVAGDLDFKGGGRSRLFGVEYTEYLSMGGHPAPPSDVGMRVYYYNNAAWAVNDAGDREKFVQF